MDKKEENTQKTADCCSGEAPFDCREMMQKMRGRISRMFAEEGSCDWEAMMRKMSCCGPSKTKED